MFKGDLTPVIYGSLYGGREEARSDQANFLSQDVAGMRAGGLLSLSSKLQLQASLGVELRDNDKNDPIFLTKRKDRQYDASFGVNFMPAQDWSINRSLVTAKTIPILI